MDFRPMVSLSIRLAIVFATLLAGQSANAAQPLFVEIGPPTAQGLAEHVSQEQRIRLNRRALQAPSFTMNLLGEEVLAIRDRVLRHKAGEHVWIGHLAGAVDDSVVITVRGNALSGVVQKGSAVYRLGLTRDGGTRLYEVDLTSLPPDDAEMPLDGQGESDPSPAGTTAGDGNVVQDLLVVYTQGACDHANGCSNLEADIVTAITQLNTAYAASGINITMNLVGMAFTNYTGTNASDTLSALRSTSDGVMDEVHPLRDQVGADIVSLIYSGQGCGIGYLNSSASYAFNVTAVSCMVGNRTLAHEIGHNQGAHHDRETVGNAPDGAHNYGYRRCSDGSVDDFGSPYFRTVMSYGCPSASRVGRFSHPYINYNGVPSGVDHAVDPAKGAWNALTLNNSATYVAGFRQSAATTVPAGPTGLSALGSGPDRVNLTWIDNATDETALLVQRSADGSTWSAIASLPANSEAFTDDGLQPETTYHYRVAAENGAGTSAFSNEAMGTTEALPASVEDVAQADMIGSGIVSGTFAATHAAGGAVQSITEDHAGGPKRSRKQSYNHGWSFDVFGGAGGSVVSVNAWVSGSEGANFLVSLDGGASWAQMFTADATPTTHTYPLPGGTAGNVRIEVRDATQSNGEAVDTVYVDHIVITSHTDPGSAPLPPSGLSASAMSATQVEVTFADNSDDEFGFELWHALSNLGDCTAGTMVETIGANAGSDVTAYHNSAAPGQTNWYWVRAFNGAGTSICTDPASAPTPVAPPPPAIDLVLNGYKVKGVQHVDLTWSGTTSSNVDVYRDGSVVATVANSGAHTDNIGRKGGGTYSYQMSEAGTSNCSPVRSFTF